MSEPISVQCPACHAKLKLKSASAVGKRVACPKCKKPFVVKAPAEEEELDFLNVSEPEPDEFGGPAAASDKEEFGEAPPVRRSSGARGKKKAKSSSVNLKPLLLGLAALLVVALLVGGGWVAYDLAGDLFTVKNKIDLTYLPPDSDFIVHVRVNEMLSAPLARSITDIPAVKTQLSTIQQELGVDPTTIQTVTLAQAGQMKAFFRAGPGQATTEPLTVVRAAAPFDVERLTTGKEPATKAEHKGTTYYLQSGANRARPVHAFYLPKRDTLVFGTKADVQASIERGTKTTKRTDLDYLDTTKQLLVVFAPKDPAEFDVPATPPGPTGQKSLAQRMQDVSRGKLHGVCVALSVSEGIDWSTTLNCADAQVPPAISAEIEKSLKEARGQLDQLRMLPNVPPKIIDLGSTILGSIRTKPNDKKLEIAGQIPGSIKATVEEFAPMAAAMLPSLMQGAGGPAPTIMQPNAAESQFPPGAFSGPPPGQSDPGPIDPNAEPRPGSFNRNFVPPEEKKP